MSTINGQTILEANIWEPLTGRWYADVNVDAQDDKTPSAPYVMTLDNGDEYHCAAIRSGLYRQRWYARLVAGTGGIHGRVPAKAYRGCPLGLALADILAETGEALDAASETLTSWIVPLWQRLQGPASYALTALSRTTGYGWHFTRDGKLWLGATSWVDLEYTAAQLVQSDRLLDRETWGPEAVMAHPGQTLNGRNIEAVATSIKPRRIRQELWYAPS